MKRWVLIAVGLVATNSLLWGGFYVIHHADMRNWYGPPLFLTVAVALIACGIFTAHQIVLLLEARIR